MGHMAHVSRLPGSGNWGIHIGKEPYVGATRATAPDDEWRDNRTVNKVIMCTRNRCPSDPRRTMSLADKEDATRGCGRFPGPPYAYPSFLRYSIGLSHPRDFLIRSSR